MARHRKIECPHCGGIFREGRPACPHCGADHETGWLSPEEQEAAEVDLSSTEMSEEEYQRFLRREGLVPDDTPQQPAHYAGGSHPILALFMLGVLLAAALWFALSY